MLPPGTYHTAAGSTLTVSGKHGGIFEVEFAWFDEDACIDCHAQAYDDEGDLRWDCEYCAGGRTPWLRDEPVRNGDEVPE